MKGTQAEKAFGQTTLHKKQASRINEELIANLKKTIILFLLEGIHCTGILTFLISVKEK